MTIADEKPWILFLYKPAYELKAYKDLIKSFSPIEYLGERTSDSFLNFIHNHQQTKGPIVGIYGSYPQFVPLGGLDEKMLQDHRWPSTVKCIAICSRGYNGLDLQALKKRDIHLYNYDDMIMDDGIVANDVADCVLWHTLEGFRKFSYHMRSLRAIADVNISRYNVVDDPDAEKFQFGSKLSKGLTIQSPKGRKCLIIGLGRIGTQCAIKLEQGLMMQVHYSSRNKVKSASPTWTYHSLSDLTAGSSQTLLSQFDCIVITVPGTPETMHMVDKDFLSKCSENVIICNVGRGNVIENEALQSHLQDSRIRHVGLDVFYNEPHVERFLLESHERCTITPHVASSTEDVWLASNAMALHNLNHVCSAYWTSVKSGSPGHIIPSGLSRVI